MILFSCCLELIASVCNEIISDTLQGQIIEMVKKREFCSLKSPEMVKV